MAEEPKTTKAQMPPHSNELFLTRRAVIKGRPINIFLLRIVGDGWPCMTALQRRRVPLP